MTIIVDVVDINECESNPCEDGGTCTDATNRYSCKCLPGYTDKNCQTSMSEKHRSYICLHHMTYYMVAVMSFVNKYMHNNNTGMKNISLVCSTYLIGRKHCSN